MMTQVSAALRDARDLIANPRNWTRLAWARDALGRIATAHDPTAVSWCVRGAILKATHHGPFQLLVDCHEAIRRLSPWRDEQGHAIDVMCVNDFECMGHDAVLQMLDATIEGLEAEAAGEALTAKKVARVAEVCA